MDRALYPLISHFADSSTFINLLNFLRMKKMYIFAVALFATTTTIAQDSNDSLTFESITLATESYYNGADEVGQIPINAAILSNSYDVTWGSWSGFAISNVTDNTTAGWANQYASFAGGGSNSSNYAVYYNQGIIEFNQPFFIRQLDVTNTAYAGISMRDGDAYAKQFGSVNGADGNPDGTNGEDFFVLHIIPLDENNTLIGDTIHYYLADFRFSDNSQDYIIDTWETVDLTSYGIVASKLRFVLESSDNGGFGMNTPAYFALDNLVINPTVGISENSISFSMYPNPTNGNLIINSNETGEVSIQNINGQILSNVAFNGTVSLDLSNAPAGIYFATLTSANGKSTQKIVKH